MYLLRYNDITDTISSVINMQKRYTRRHTKLKMEIALLRKGRGINVTKLHDKLLLREAIAQAMGIESNSITDGQVYSFLLIEIDKLPDTVATTALRYAFATADETKTNSTLYQRRQRLALLLEKHPDTIIRYENQAIDDLVAKLHELAASSTRSVGPSNTPRPLHAPKLFAHTTIMRTTAALNLTGLLPIANYGPELVHYLEQSQRPYLDVTVEVKFLPSSRGADWYRLDVKYVFTGMRETFRLAVVVESHDGEQLMTAGLIDDFHKLNDQIDPRQEIRTIINNSRFIAHNHAAHKQKSFRFSQLESSHANVLLRSVDRSLKNQCRFIEVTLPPEWQGKDIIYEYESTFNLRDDIHYAYWYAPSMMYIKKLTYDYSDFPEVEKWSFVTMPFLGNVSGKSTRGKHSFTVHPDDWIMPGHGIALTWEPLPNQEAAPGTRQ